MEGKNSTGGLQTESLYTGNYAAYLSGISGTMNDQGDQVFIYTSNTTNQTSSLNVNTDNNTLKGWATTFGVDHTPLLGALYSNPTQWDATTNSSDPNMAENDIDFYRNVVKLASTDDHFCYLTRIKGKFDGAGEAVKLYQEGNYWYLSTQAGCDDYDDTPLVAGVYFCNIWKRVEASARCYKYNQN